MKIQLKQGRERKGEKKKIFLKMVKKGNIPTLVSSVRSSDQPPPQSLLSSTSATWQTTFAR